MANGPPLNRQRQWPMLLIGQHPTEYREPLSMAWTLPRYMKPAIEAIARARSGAGPTLLECKTYRYYDHVGRDFGILRRGPGRDCLVACAATPIKLWRETPHCSGRVRRHHGRCDHDTHWGRHGTRDYGGGAGAGSASRCLVYRCLLGELSMTNKTMDRGHQRSHRSGNEP